jgi:hypothetical protein
MNLWWNIGAFSNGGQSQVYDLFDPGQKQAASKSSVTGGAPVRSTTALKNRSIKFANTEYELKTRKCYLKGSRNTRLHPKYHKKKY